MRKTEIDVGTIFTNNQGCKAVVLNYENSRKVTVEFMDGFSHQMQVKKANLISGSFSNPYHKSVKGVGYVGVGSFTPSSSRVKSREYKTWLLMMTRCYDAANHIKHPTYRDCSVHPDWHNFQNFAEWYVNNEFYGLGYYLDKDLLVKGNRVYSPETCVLVPNDINVLLNDNEKQRGDYPIGVSMNKKAKKFEVKIKRYGVKFHLGYFTDLDRACLTYNEAKVGYIKEVANKWKGRIDDRVFHSLIDSAEQYNLQLRGLNVD